MIQRLIDAIKERLEGWLLDVFELLEEWFG